MKNIGQDEARILRAAINEALSLVEEEHGVKCQIGNITYRGVNMTTRLTVTAQNSDGTVDTKETTDFKTYAEIRYGMKKSDLNRTFNFRGRTYTLVGAKPRSSKFPLLGKRDDGKVFKFGVDLVKMKLAETS